MGMGTCFSAVENHTLRAAHVPMCSSLRRASQCHIPTRIHPRLHLLGTCYLLLLLLLLLLWHKHPHLALSHWEIGSQVVRASSPRLARPSLTPASTVNKHTYP